MRLFLKCLLFTVATFVYSDDQVERITSILGEPFLMLKRDHLTYLGNEMYEGFSKDLADMLAARLNISYKMTLVGDSKYGTQANGKWNGMIGELLNEGVADMCIAPLTITKERRSAVEFSTPFLEFQLAILLRRSGFGADGAPLVNTTKSSVTSPSQSLVLRPFSNGLWAILVTVLVFLVATPFFLELVFYKLNLNKEAPSTSGLLFQFVLWIFVALVLAEYLNSFVSYKLADMVGRKDDDKPLAVRSLTDLGSQDVIKFGVIRAGSTFEYFKGSPDRIHRKVYTSMTRDKLTALPRTIEEGVSRVRYGTAPYAFIMESPYAAYQTTLKPCNVVMTSSYFGPKKAFAVATRPGYHLREQINLAVLLMKENGELEELEDKWMHGTNECESATETDSNEALDSTKLDFGIILELSWIVLVTLLASAGILVAELYIAKKLSRKDVTIPEKPIRKPISRAKTSSESYM